MQRSQELGISPGIVPFIQTRFVLSVHRNPHDLVSCPSPRYSSQLDEPPGPSHFQAAVEPGGGRDDRVTEGPAGEQMEGHRGTDAGAVRKRGEEQALQHAQAEEQERESQESRRVVR